MPTLRCRLFGCWITEHTCERCGTYLYDGEVQVGLLDPLLDWLATVRAWLRPIRCDHCGKGMGWRGRRDVARFCSPECEDAWLPF